MDQYLLISPSLPPVGEIRQYLSSLPYFTHHRAYSKRHPNCCQSLDFLSDRNLHRRVLFFSTPILSEADLMSLEYLEESPQGSE